MSSEKPTAFVIGAGPAGLMAAQMLLEQGVAVEMFDAMPSPARKFLLAGKGGLNLTHSEPLERFLPRYGARAEVLEPLVGAFPPEGLRDWAKALGIDTFVGSSGRVFPTDFKAAPLLRAWLRRLKGMGLVLRARHRWTGWAEDGSLLFATSEGGHRAAAPAVVLALGGASWPKLGSDGTWVEKLAARGVPVAPLKPANCGFDLDWSEPFRTRFAGQPLKPVQLSFSGTSLRGEVMLTETGIEGGAVYALSAALRDAIERDGTAELRLDLRPDWSAERLAQALAKPRGSRSATTQLERATGLKGAAAGLLREVLGPEWMADAARLTGAIKALPLRLLRPRPLAEAISTAGGVPFEALDEGLMLKALPGVFLAGEMLDWEAPTGGYLLTACFATGRAAGLGAARYLGFQHTDGHRSTQISN